MIISFIIWNLFGGFIQYVVAYNYSLNSNPSYRILNPFFIYNYHRVNVFGAIVVALFYNLLCPVISMCYWFYKLCTVGRQ